MIFFSFLFFINVTFAVSLISVIICKRRSSQGNSDDCFANGVENLYYLIAHRRVQPAVLQSDDLVAALQRIALRSLRLFSFCLPTFVSLVAPWAPPRPLKNQIKINQEAEPKVSSSVSFLLFSLWLIKVPGYICNWKVMRRMKLTSRRRKKKEKQFANGAQRG